MPDANLRQAVRESLHLSEAQPLTPQMMRRLTELNSRFSTPQMLTAMGSQMYLTLWLSLMSLVRVHQISTMMAW